MSLIENKSFEELTRSLASVMRQLGRQSYGIIYLITNTDNGKRYIGQTTQIVIYKRYWTHLQKARQKVNHPLYDAINKYGEGAFKYETIASCDNKQSLDAAEEHFIELYKTRWPNGYNLKSGGACGLHSDESKRKISAALAQPEVKERQRAIMKIKTKEAMAKPENKRNHVAAMNRPEVKAKRSIILKAAFARPATQALRRGRKWITNELLNRRIKKGEPLPNGWRWGYVYHDKI